MKLYRPVNASAYTLYDEINSIVNRLIVVSFYLDYLEIFRPSIGVSIGSNKNKNSLLRSYIYNFDCSVETILTNIVGNVRCFSKLRSFVIKRLSNQDKCSDV